MAENEHVLTEKILAMPGSFRKSKVPMAEYEKNIPLDKYINEIEAKIIRDTLMDTGGNISRAAEQMQIKRQTKLSFYHAGCSLINFIFSPEKRHSYDETFRLSYHLRRRNLL